MQSTDTAPDPNNGRFSGSILGIGTHTLTNDTTGFIDVQLGAQQIGSTGPRIIQGLSTFNNFGRINVADGLELALGRPEGAADDTFLTVSLTSGQIDGKLVLTNSRLAMGSTNDLTGTANLEMRGVNNQILSGDLDDDFTMTLMGTEPDVRGSSLVAMQASMNIFGTLVFNSDATQMTPNETTFPGSILNINSHTLTNDTVGLIDVQAGSGNGAREIQGTGTFLNLGDISVASGQVLNITGLTSVDKINVNLNAGLLQEGIVGLINANIIFGGAFGVETDP